MGLIRVPNIPPGRGTGRVPLANPGPSLSSQMRIALLEDRPGKNALAAREALLRSRFPRGKREPE